eukprot:8799307-Lingulodinium_polyedra.AAC.1
MASILSALVLRACFTFQNYRINVIPRALLSMSRVVGAVLADILGTCWASRTSKWRPWNRCVVWLR